MIMVEMVTSFSFHLTIPELQSGEVPSNSSSASGTEEEEWKEERVDRSSGAGSNYLVM